LKTLVFLFLLFFTTVSLWAQEIDSTELITVRSIILEGNDKTKERYITRELSFDQGSQYQRWELDSMFVWDRNRIYNTNLFNEIDFSIVNESNGNADVKIVVQERWYFYPFPIFRLVDRNFNDWWVNRDHDLSRANIGLKLTQYNFRGRGEKLRVSAQFGFETRINFNYQLPYIDKKQRIGLDLDFNYMETKNLAYDTENSIPVFISDEDNLLRTIFRNKISGSYRSSFYSYHTVALSHLSAHIADTISSLNSNYFDNGANDQKSLRFGYAYIWDKRNNRNYPTSGEWIAIGFTKFGLGVYDDVDYWALGGSLSKYIDLGKNNYAATSLIGEFTFPGDRPYFNYSAIGYQRNVLRGFDLYIAEGSSFVIHKNEIKRKLFSYKADLSRYWSVKQFQSFPLTIYGKLFFDQGYAKSFPGHDGSDLLDDDYLFSYGIGIDLITVYDAVFRFELSRNSLNQNNLFINFGYKF
jgi:outer membrane protein assembly factor BamA